MRTGTGRSGPTLAAVSAAAAGPGTTRLDPERPEVHPATGVLGTNRLDAALTAAFVLVGLVQVTLFPIADAGLGHLFVLGTTLPLAWRRTRPVEAVRWCPRAFWLVPVHGYPVLGFVVAVLFFFALGAHGRPLVRGGPARPCGAPRRAWSAPCSGPSRRSRPSGR